MPSSITLTVSHLPTSTSFFLSALQPLNYAYRGKSGQTVGFGPLNSNAPPDFWITQEIPGVPAGAAHVAFPAFSQRAVQDFFMAALKAGGQIHGEPALRDANGYYSAAVIDFDGNSIEAVYRPGFGQEDKENDVRSVVSHRTSSKAPIVVSKSSNIASKARSVAPSQAPTTASQKSAGLPKGDALDRILAEARNTAHVARNLVDQVRPNLNSTHSAPVTTTTTNGPGAGDAIFGTLLGVAAGAALGYAMTNRKSSNSGSSGDDDDESLHSRARRPSLPRSTTEPHSATHPHHHYRAIDAAPSSRYIAMQDNDSASTVRPSSRARTTRRGSVDSGIGISPPSTASSKASKRNSGSVKMLEAPPTSYKAPSVLTSATQKTQQTQQSARSHSGSRRRSSSASRGGEGSEAKTILHVTESLKRVESFPPGQRGSARSSQAPSQAPSTHSKHSSASRKRSTSKSSSSRSHATTTTIRPEAYPLPPSRAATWAGSAVHSERGGAPASAGSAKTVMGRMGWSGEAGRGRRDVTGSVVGKTREAHRVDVGGGEVRPEDSVSQVGSVRGRRGR